MGNTPLVPNMTSADAAANTPQAPVNPGTIPPQFTPPSAPSAPTGVQPTSTPQATPQTPAIPKAPPTPAQQHASIFHNVFSLLAGGGNRPQMNPDGSPKVDPATGNVVMGQASTKRLGMGILAGAISGMMAGMATPPSYQKFGNASVPDYSGAFGAGAKAAEPFTQQGAKTAAQKEADDLRTRQFTTMKQNLDMHLLMQSVHRGDRQDMEQAANDYTEKLDDLEAAQAKGNIKDKDGNPMDLLMDGYYTKEQGLEMLQKKQISSVNDQLIPAKVVDAPVDPNDPSKGYYPVMMFKIATNAALGNVELTDDMVKDLPDRYKNAVGSTVPVQLLFKDAATKAHAHQAAGTAADWQEEYDKLNPTAKTTEGFNYETWSKNNPNDARALNPWLLAHKGQHVDEAISGPKGILENPDFRKDGKAVSAFAKLQSDMGINANGLTAISNKRVETLKQEEKGPDQQPADAIAIANFSKNVASRGLDVTPGQIATVQDTLGKNPTVKDVKDAYDKILTVSAENKKAKLQDQGIDEKQQKMLLDYGQAGKLRLNLDNASDEMLVNQRTGNPIPNKSLTALKASQTEVNRAQFATTVLHLADSLRKAQAAGTLPNGPITGLTKEALGKAGLNDADAAKALTEISLLQSAATGAHVGGRFSVPVLDKMAGLLKLNMNDSQFLGSLDAITDTMQTYKDNGGRFSVAEWKALPQQERNRLMGQDVAQAAGVPANRPAPPPGFEPAK